MWLKAFIRKATSWGLYGGKADEISMESPCAEVTVALFASVMGKYNHLFHQIGST